MKRFLVLSAVSVFSLIIPASTLAGTITVPADYITIQAAIDNALHGDTVQVAAGTYYEDITLKSGVTVQGAGADNTIIEGTGTKSVVTAINVAPGAMIDGFTITNGYAEWPPSSPPPYESGGGIYLENSSPTISNNIITGNQGIIGGINIFDGSSPLIDKNIITGNQGWVGGIYIHDGSSPTVSRNDINGNSTVEAAIRIIGSGSPIIDSNNISGNIGWSPYSYYPPQVLVMNNIDNNNPPALIINNKIDGDFGLVIWDDSGAIITNNTFIGHEISGTVESIGITCLGSSEYPSIMIFTNNIVWGFERTFNNACVPPSDVSVTHSCIEDTSYGPTNIPDDPKFVDAAGGDYHLQPDSPCIDNGSNAAVPSWLTTDLDGKPRIWNVTVDIGAYEFTVTNPGETPEGEDISVTPVDPAPVVPGITTEVSFYSVIEFGITTVTSSGSGTPPPTGFSLGDPPVYIDIQTTATVAPPIKVCINYTGISYSDENMLRLFHQPEGGALEDVTSSLDTVNDIICGVVSSLSPFAVLEASYQFVGFFDPIQTGEGVVNLLKAGSAIPLKWQLKSESGGFIDDLSVIKGIHVSERECEDSSLLNDLEETVTSGNSGMRYDYTSNQFIYNWKSAKNMAGKCYQLNVELFGFDFQGADFQMW